MPAPIIKTATVEELKNLFEWDGSLLQHKNISILGEKFLISILKAEGYDFDFTIAREEKGKPYFLYNNKVHFSVSDTKNYIAVAVHTTRIGVDIEYLRQGKQQLAQRFFHPAETDYLNKTSRADYDKAFTQLWTIKEAYVKMTGTGIAGNFSTLNLAPLRFELNQSYTAYDALITSSYDSQTELFITCCALQ